MKFHRIISLPLLAGCLVQTSVLASQTNSPVRFVLDMVHDNRGELPQATAFRDPNAWDDFHSAPSR